MSIYMTEEETKELTNINEKINKKGSVIISTFGIHSKTGSVMIPAFDIHSKMSKIEMVREEYSPILTIFFVTQTILQYSNPF